MVIVRQQICLDVFPRTGQTKPRHARDFSNQSLFDPSQPVSRPTKPFCAYQLVYIYICVCVCLCAKKTNKSGKTSPVMNYSFFSSPAVAFDYSSPSSYPSSNPCKRFFDFLTYTSAAAAAAVRYQF